MKQISRYALCGALCLTALLCGCQKEDSGKNEAHTLSSYAMSTVITQTAYGSGGEEAMKAVSERLIDIEQELSLYDANSYISAINAAAGVSYVKVPQEVYDLLKASVEYSAKSENAFRITIAPITEAWGVTTDHPRVVPQSEIDQLMSLVNDDDVLFNDEDCSVMLRRAGQALDLGGIAKGWAGSVASALYKGYGVENAILSIGGNVFVHGTKPDGTLFKIGFRDPEKGEQSYIASFPLKDKVVAVSGGYERYFEEDGIKYQHIMNPATGAPAVSDVGSVGVISENGTYADFMSTTLYVWGLEKTKAYMQSGKADCEVILLDSATHTLYVSASLKDGFKLNDNNTEAYTVVYL